ncbi:hypothetical protein AMTRI_Chr04g180060 [Amborella trichopoda]
MLLRRANPLKSSFSLYNNSYHCVSSATSHSLSTTFNGYHFLSLLRHPTLHNATHSSRAFSTATTGASQSAMDWRNGPPREAILVEGCDYEHWLVVMEPPQGHPLRDQIVDTYVKILAMVLGSEEDAKKAIYSVSTKYYYAFGCKVSKEISHKIKGEPFIDGKVVPYHEKYHAYWLTDQDDNKNQSQKIILPRNRSKKFRRRRDIMYHGWNGQNNSHQPARDLLSRDSFFM